MKIKNNSIIGCEECIIYSILIESIELLEYFKKTNIHFNMYIVSIIKILPFNLENKKIIKWFFKNIHYAVIIIWNEDPF